jgi:hypothetical protein
MTAPSLLDELEGVVKFLLGERPLDGRWFGDDPPVTASGMKRHYWWRTDLRKAHADMAKRLEAAERDASPVRCKACGRATRVVCDGLDGNGLGCTNAPPIDIAATQEGEG